MNTKKTIITVLISAGFAFHAMSENALLPDVSNISWVEKEAINGNSFSTGKTQPNYKITGNSFSEAGNGEYTLKITAEYADNLWFKSGTTKITKDDTYAKYRYKGERANVRGAKYLTILGDVDGTGPTITSMFRGAALQTDKDAYVYVYGGLYQGLFAGVSHYTGYNSQVGYDGSTPITTTGHLILHGGEFKENISGFGMVSDGSYTANIDIQVLGEIKMRDTATYTTGVFGGAMGSTSGASLYGNTNVSVSGEGKTNFVVGGNRYSSILVGNSSVSVTDGGTVSAVVGGNFYVDVNATTATHDGNVSVTISNGNVGSTEVTKLEKGDVKINGVVAAGINTSLTGQSEIDISGTSKVKGAVVAGSLSMGTTSVDKTTLNISGGTIEAIGNSEINGAFIENNIYGGTVAVSTGDAVANATITKGSSINISGGAISGDIYAGGYALGTSEFSATSTVNGGSSINIDVKEKLSIDGDMYLGGNQGANGTSVVDGGADITFKNSENVEFAFTGNVSGAGKNGAVVNGDTSINFDTFNSTFDATFSDFDNVKIESSDMEFTKGSEIKNMTIDANSSVKFSELIISDASNIDIADGANVEIENFMILISEDLGLEAQLEFNFANIDSIVLSQIAEDGSNFFIKDLSGDILKVSADSFFKEGSVIKMYAAVPEASTYAMIFGAIALGFVAYRRRK